MANLTKSDGNPCLENGPNLPKEIKLDHVKPTQLTLVSVEAQRYETPGRLLFFQHCSPAENNYVTTH